SMHIIQKLIRHPKATKYYFPVVLRCILCDKEIYGWVEVQGKYLGQKILTLKFSRNVLIWHTDFLY
ncbi:MAG: hypothetical protein ACOC56_02885, partial [Atribacterota bacterium]